MKRMQSPSSINTYFQCPRKYYYNYQLKLPTQPSIHLIRGSVAHSVLENIFKLPPDAILADYQTNLQIITLELLKKFWDEEKTEFDKLDLSESVLNEYYKETQLMLINWLNQFINKLDNLIAKGKTFVEAFNSLKPETEIEYRSEELMVRGFIDAIEKDDNKIRLMDYKTSKRAEINDAYRLQLAIYAMLYEEKHDVRPDRVGIYFLRESEQLLNVDDELIDHAKFMVEQIHMSTDGVEDISQYPKKESPLCRYSTGQCDFYDYCFNGKKAPEANKSGKNEG